MGLRGVRRVLSMTLSGGLVLLALPSSAAAAVDPTFCTGPNGGPSGSPSFLFNDDMENPASGNWALTGDWSQGAAAATSGTQALIGATPGAAATTYEATMTRDVTIPDGAFLRFNHDYNFEAGDGGVVEFSTDGGATWNDVQGGGAIEGPLASGLFNYSPGQLSDVTNPLTPRRAFQGDSGGYQTVRIPIDSVAGDSFRFRFVIGTDAANGGDPWLVDDFSIYNCPPDIAITGGTPDGALVQARGRDSGVNYTFTSNGEQGRFECRVVPADGSSAPHAFFTACFSPFALDDWPPVGINEGGIGEGKFTFEVRGVELSPLGRSIYSAALQRTFTVSYSCAQAESFLRVVQGKLKKAKDRLKRYKKSLKKAEESGEADRIEAAEEKVAKAKKKVKAAKKKVKKKQAIVDRECGTG